jgi:hypothetical protein
MYVVEEINEMFENAVAVSGVAWYEFVESDRFDEFRCDVVEKFGEEVLNSEEYQE